MVLEGHQSLRPQPCLRLDIAEFWEREAGVKVLCFRLRPMLLEASGILLVAEAMWTAMETSIVS